MKSLFKTMLGEKRSAAGSAFSGSGMADSAICAMNQLAWRSVFSRTAKASLMVKMALFTLLASVGMLLPTKAEAQGASIYGQVVDAFGHPVPFGKVRVCPYTASGFPCSPLSSLYSDLALTHSIPNPYTTDQVGNYTFFVNPGAYQVQITVAPFTTYAYQITAYSGSFTFLGTYNPATTYSMGNVVIYNGVTYTSLVFNNRGNTPSTSPSDWGPFASQPGAAMLNPTADQSITQPSGTNFFFSGINCGQCITFGSQFNGQNWTAPTNYVNQLAVFTPNAFGPGSDVGFAGSLPGPYQAETVNKVMYISDNARMLGISQTLSEDFSPKHDGDTMWAYVYGHMRSGWVSSASEGSGIININGTMEQGYPIGTVSSTTGTGDRHPVLSVNDLGTGSYLIDTSKLVTSGTVTAQVAAHYGSTPEWLLPVTGSITPSTGVCQTTTDIPQSFPVQTLIARSVTCTVIGGTSSAMTNGQAWLVSILGIEQVILSNVTGSGTQTFTISSQKPFPVGSRVYQGGTSGLLSLSANVYRTAINIFGAADSTHLICGMLQPGTMSPCRPYFGNESATAGSGYNIYPGAEVLSVDANGANEALEQNNVAWAASDNVENPANISQREQDITVTSSPGLSAYPEPGAGAGSLILNMGGGGVTNSWCPFCISNFNSPSYYGGLGGGGGGVQAPSAIQLYGTYANTIILQAQPIDGMGTIPCNGGTLFCIQNSTNALNMGIVTFADRVGQFLYNTTTNTWTFVGQVAMTSTLSVGGSGGNFFTVTGSGGMSIAGGTTINNSSNIPIIASGSPTGACTLNGYFTTVVDGVTVHLASCN